MQAPAQPGDSGMPISCLVTPKYMIIVQVDYSYPLVLRCAVSVYYTFGSSDRSSQLSMVCLLACS